jgi:TRAP-type C4-dicarboxylate transport system permease small subunit
MLGGVALNAANVFSRYVLGSAIFWTEEVLVVITIWGVFLGVAGVAWKGEHLSMDLFSARLRGPARTLVNGLTALCLVAVCGFVAWQSWSIVGMHAQMGSVSPGAQIPRVIPHAALALGFSLTALVVAWRIRLYLRGAPGERP